MSQGQLEFTRAITEFALSSKCYPQAKTQQWCLGVDLDRFAKQCLSFIVVRRCELCQAENEQCKRCPRDRQ